MFVSVVTEFTDTCEIKPTSDRSNEVAIKIDEISREFNFLTINFCLREISPPFSSFKFCLPYSDLKFASQTI